MFLPIEEIFMALQGKGVSTPDVQAKGYKLVEDRVSEILDDTQAVSFEITVLTPHSKDLLSRLAQSFQVELIQVYAPLSLCLERIKMRDQTKHINIAEDRITEINTLSINQQLDTKLKIDTSMMNDQEILEKFKLTYVV